MLTASLRLAAESGADKENDLVIRLDSFCIKSHMVACRRAVTTSGHLRGLVGLRKPYRYAFKGRSASPTSLFETQPNGTGSRGPFSFTEMATRIGRTATASWLRVR